MAYNTATLIQKFTGNAGEPTVRLEYYVTPTDTAQTIRRWAIEQAKNLGDVKSIADSLTVGQSINLTPITPPAATAEEIWRAKVARYVRMKDLGLSGQAVTDLAALKADIEATYLSVYL